MAYKSNLKNATLFAFLVLTIKLSSADPVKFYNEAEVKAYADFKLLSDAFARGFSEETPMAKNAKGRLVDFSFSNCGPKSEIVSVKSFNIKPNPIRLPGNLTFSGVASINATFGKPLTASLTVHKKVLGFWVKVPCVDDLGSCTYHDVCAKLAKAVGNKCPKDLVKQGFNCKCPFTPRVLTVKNLTTYVKAKIPSIADGEVKAQVKVTSGSKYITCINLEVDLE